MKILLNSICLLNQRTGIGEYTYNIFKELSNYDQVNIDLFDGNKIIKNFNQILKTPKVSKNAQSFIRDRIFFSYELARFIRQINFNSVIKKNAYSIYHEPNFISFNSNIPTVLNIHDLSWITCPDFHPLKRVKCLKKYVPISINKSKKIIVDSHYVKKELLNHFELNEKNVHVIYLASKYKFKNYKNDLEEYLATKNLTFKNFFICVGTLEPRKNLINCINSYLLLPKSIRNNYPLLVVGPVGWKFNKSSLEIDETIRFLGYVDNKSLNYLYHGALALLYLSIYEGFGLPPLEAMSCKTAVITSNKGTLKELYSKCSISIDPYNSLEISQNMLKLIEDRKFELHFIKKGYAFSKNFSWEKTARQTLNVYKKILS